MLARSFQVSTDSIFVCFTCSHILPTTPIGSVSGLHLSGGWDHVFASIQISEHEDSALTLDGEVLKMQPVQLVDVLRGNFQTHIDERRGTGVARLRPGIGADGVTGPIPRHWHGCGCGNIPLKKRLASGSVEGLLHVEVDNAVTRDADRSIAR